MNAILRGCNRADSMYFGSFVSAAAPACPGRCAAVAYETKRYLPTPIMTSSWMRRDSSAKRTHDPRSRGAELNDSAKTH
jgi:hypothetical protein